MFDILKYVIDFQFTHVEQTQMCIATYKIKLKNVFDIYYYLCYILVTNFTVKTLFHHAFINNVCPSQHLIFRNLSIET